MIWWSLKIETITHVVKSCVNLLNYTKIYVRIYLIKLVLESILKPDVILSMSEGLSILRK